MQLPFELDRPLAFLDLETTGLNPRTDRIVELAIIRVTPDGEVLERARRYNPGIPIPEEHRAYTGSRTRTSRESRRSHRRPRSLLELIDPCDLAGFNIRRFDLPILIAEFRRAGLRFDVRDRRIVDVQAIFHREERRDLTAAARFYLGRDHEDAHSAIGDTRTSAAVLLAQIERYGHLPRTLAGLHEYCDQLAPFETELDRWFVDGGRGAGVSPRQAPGPPAGGSGALRSGTTSTGCSGRRTWTRRCSRSCGRALARVDAPDPAQLALIPDEAAELRWRRPSTKMRWRPETPRRPRFLELDLGDPYP